MAFEVPGRFSFPAMNLHGRRPACGAASTTLGRSGTTMGPVYCPSPSLYFGADALWSFAGTTEGIGSSSYNMSALPVFGFQKGSRVISMREVNPGHYFDKAADEYCLKSSTIYDLVLTQPLPLDDCEIHGANHPRCISGKCECSNLPTSYESVRRAGLKQARRIIRNSPEIRKLLETMPSLAMNQLLPK